MDVTNRTHRIQPRENTALIAVLGAVALLLVASVFTSLNFGLSDRTAFILLVVIGMSMCGLGKLGKGDAYGWFNPRHIAGYVVGTVGLLLAAGVLLGWSLPWISSEREAILALSGLMLVKIAIAASYPHRAER